jgi:hypothetical protein
MNKFQSPNPILAMTSLNLFKEFLCHSIFTFRFFSTQNLSLAKSSSHHEAFCDAFRASAVRFCRVPFNAIAI